MQQRYLLQILLLAQHVSGTTVPIIRSSRVLYSGCCLWYLVLWFSSCWSGVELRLMCPVCRMLVNIYQSTLCHNPEHCCIKSHCYENIKYYDHRELDVHAEDQMCTHIARCTQTGFDANKQTNAR